MTVASPTGASSHDLGDWHAINWQKAHQNVRRLQARIVKATKQGRWGKVKALQRLLTHSFSGKALAVKRVTENRGKGTPGVDGEVWRSSAGKWRAIHALRPHGYHPQPLRRMYIPKSNGKKRPLGIPTMRDRAMQALYLLALQPVAETTADQNSYGFRPERSTTDAIKQCYSALRQKGSAAWVLEGDIKSCFDRIDHDWLLAHVPMDKSILQKWLKAGYMEQHILYPTDAGTPQGGIISPVLANLALDGLERLLRTRYPINSSRQRRGKVNLIRYADDFVITGASREMLEHEVLPLVKEFMRVRGLELSEEKTCITHIEDGFDFLGQHVRKYNGVLLITPSKKSVKAFLAKVRKLIKDNATVTAGELIALLSPVIRGWVRYHQYINCTQTFSNIDRHIFQALWRWALRRHPNTSRRWIRKKYFRTGRGRGWHFYGEHEGKKHLLPLASNVPKAWYVKVKGEANPFDPDWEVYFEERLGVKMVDNLKGRRQLLRLWKEQEGRCPICTEKITQVTGWHNHHITWRSLGGKDTSENRVLLHPNCHRQVHSQKLTVRKPRPADGGERDA